MRSNVSVAPALVAALFAGSMGLASADQARSGAYAGVQSLLLTGVHSDVHGDQHGLAGGAILQAGVRGKRIALHVEGIPPVSLPQRASSAYGRATPQLALINGAARFALDSLRNIWLGVGMTVINQRTPLPAMDQTVSSRLAGMRFEISYRRPLGASRFFEATFGGAPHLAGSDHYAYTNPRPTIDKPEIAAEEDAMFAFGLRRGASEWLIGVRTIGFSARYALTEAAADRNNGAGLLFEWRRVLLH